jgi:A/G-specific adenine glycosylase
LQPLQWQLPARARVPTDLPAGRWVTREEALALGLPAPLRRLIQG